MASMQPWSWLAPTNITIIMFICIRLGRKWIGLQDDYTINSHCISNSIIIQHSDSNSSSLLSKAVCVWYNCACWCTCMQVWKSNACRGGERVILLGYIMCFNYRNVSQLALYPGHMGGSRKTFFGTYEGGKLLTSHMSSMTMAISSPWGVVDSVIAPHRSASKIRMSDVYSTVGEYAADNNMMWSLFKIIVTYVSIMYASTPSPLAVHV